MQQHHVRNIALLMSTFERQLLWKDQTQSVLQRSEKSHNYYDEPSTQKSRQNKTLTLNLRGTMKGDNKVCKIP